MSTSQAPLDISAPSVAISNTSCRILVVSPSLSQATTLISRIQNLGQSSSSTPERVIEGDKDLLSPDLIKIPWTIENKYYSADVHFAAHPMRGLAPYLLQNVPAVIFVWGSDEVYKHHIERISRDLGEHEPEVLLAVRVKSVPGEMVRELLDDDDEERGEDNASIDGYVSGFGFEYVDATQNESSRQPHLDEVESDGIPNLPRVPDALSTIMWPSMKAQAKDSKHTKRGRDPSLFDWGNEGTSDKSSSLASELMPSSSSDLSTRAGRMRNEMEELANWLENDVRDGDKEDPWRLAARSDAIVVSSTEGDSDDFLASSEVAASKFDDDFTIFVSSPPETGTVESGRSTPTGDEDDEDGLRPPESMRSYNSLGSVSDLGEGKELENAYVVSDDEDDGLPTQGEIFETSSRIFGKNVSRSTADAQPIYGSKSDLELGEAELEDNDYDMAPFDLSRVLGTLQQMKEDISGIEDESERRKAAARVALGLVYGLEAESDLN
ncbi:hypothetical protein AGABI1DRAFT_113845 [Agaricus bisporus var. burnettii JB137-S8]|uniref:Alpha/gamma-adaptin-binding protein p34 n=1 Tax=Agaricus bisporus var. burnettii (strain JB137-S8 / ATCC MYA-4627 / FGSC 10392) TaxID=597362 RepID=K5VXQ2_AGABU|nr:uncharacterized protein AGABI1DRAFT_113845 [Agaricus bisporus var. burnettii JB137-S8]EKM79269.1 hypothetical protein AGABI1DRAFT_113845 [Agaricus bisporus var. burnettii JB137-S8]